MSLLKHDQQFGMIRSDHQDHVKGPAGGSAWSACIGKTGTTRSTRTTWRSKPSVSKGPEAATMNPCEQCSGLENRHRRASDLYVSLMIHHDTMIGDGGEAKAQEGAMRNARRSRNAAARPFMAHKPHDELSSSQLKTNVVTQA
jgi:hypothetical protein